MNPLKQAKELYEQAREAWARGDNELHDRLMAQHDAIYDKLEAMDDKRIQQIDLAYRRHEQAAELEATR